MQDKVKVWDPLVRIFHWSLVLSFFVAFITEDELMLLHSYAGYMVLGLVSLRLLWGLVGTRHARFSDFVRPPREAIDYLKQLSRLKAPHYLGHNPAGGLMILALLTLLLLTTGSGLLAYGAEGYGPLAGTAIPAAGLWKEAHELLANLTLLAVLLHIGGVVAGQLLQGEKLVQAMITGYKERHQ